MDTRLAALLAASTLLACSSGSSASPEADSGPWTDGGDTYGAPKRAPCDVDALLDRWSSPPADPTIVGCRSCHGATPKFGAPMSLVTYEDLVAPAPSDRSKKVYERIGARIHDDKAPMPQAPNPRLTAAELAVFDAWIAGGAQERASGIECSTPDAGPTDATPPPPACTPDTTVASTLPWTMPTDTSDIYICYGVDLPVSAKRHITTFVPKIDNTKIVHHILLMQSDTTVDPTPKPCASGDIAKWRMLYGWAPGGKTFDLPPQAGFAMEGTTHFVVQTHYNNLKKLVGEKDTSGFGLCTTDKLRANDADVLAFGSAKFTIPAKGKLDLLCNLPVSSLPPLHVIGAFPHMHQLGRTISTVLHRKSDGASIDLGNVPSWDFSTQIWQPIPDVLVSNGDNVETNCVWENPGDAPVGFGERTQDEMCYSFTMYYPKVKSSVWSWMLPVYAAGCAPR